MCGKTILIKSLFGDFLLAVGDVLGWEKNQEKKNMTRIRLFFSLINHDELETQKPDLFESTVYKNVLQCHCIYLR